MENVKNVYNVIKKENMKKFLTPVLIVVILIISAGIYKFNFTNDDIYIEKNGVVVPYDDIKNITTSIVPLASLAHTIGWTSVEVTNLVPAWVSPHNFDLSPKQVQQIVNSDLLISLGLEHIDGFLEDIPWSTWGLRVSNGIELIEEWEVLKLNQHDSHDDHDSHHADPHIWTGPENAKIIAKKITNAFIELDASKKDYFESNYDKLSLSIDDTVASFKKNTSWKTLANFIVFHDAYNYLFSDLGIESSKKTIFRSNVLTNPNASEIKEILDQIKNQNIKYIFTEPQFNDGNVLQFAKKHNLEILVLDPLGDNISDSGYLNTLESNLKNLEKIYE